ncbi:MAG: SDR family NAD(P)-dependent oxidoreductase [Phycisphaeraceae bacterium]|nr:SDR family NAD(P)-dependent oxidoreductase [Phycisphaeraceae bacterium]
MNPSTEELKPWSIGGFERLVAGVERLIRFNMPGFDRLGCFSVKIDGNEMLISSDQTPIHSLHAECMVLMDRLALDDRLRAEPDQAGPGQTLDEYRNLLRAKLDPIDPGRPPLDALPHHAVPHRIILHVHPVAAMELCCDRNGGQRIAELFGGSAAWLPSGESRHQVARRLAQRFKAEQVQRSLEPRIVVFENDGILIAADAVEDFERLIDELIQRFPPPQAISKSEPDELPDAIIEWVPMLRGLLADEGALPILACDFSAGARRMTMRADFNPAGLLLHPEGQIVCGPAPMMLRLDAGLEGKAIRAAIQEAINDYRSQHDQLPRVVLIEGLGIIASSRCIDQARRCLDLFRALIQLNDRIAEPNHLSQDHLSAIARRHAALRAAQTPPRCSGRMAGRIALVTGAAQGFGLEISRHLVSQGACVVLGDVNADGAEQAGVELEKTHGPGRAIGLAMNVMSVQSVHEAALRTVAAYGGLDLLVSNAGVLRAASVKTMSERDFTFVTDVNYTGYFRCVQGLCPIMAAQHTANPSAMADIIQINSKSGLVGSNRNGAYAGGKFGGIGLTQSFALELIEDGIKVNAICPGNFFDGPLWSDPENGLFVQYLRTGKVPGAKSIEDVKHAYEAKVPMGRGCRALDVMQAIYYLVDQAYETGQAVPVTGGQVMLS